MAGPRAGHSRPKPVNTDVFLNIPFDSKYERLYFALVAGLSGLGLTPRSVLEVETATHRLDRILELVRACGSSIHDLSRIELSSNSPRCPRFNMPFELGLAVAWAKSGGVGHSWFVFERVRFRLQKSLSDLNGFDPFIHDGTVQGLLSQLTNMFVRTGAPARLPDLKVIYRDLRKFALKELGGRSGGLYEPMAFRRLVVAAREFSERRKVIEKSTLSVHKRMEGD